MKNRIIINADDLGMSVEVNSAIEKAIIDGCISSSTIMANAPAFEDAIRIAKRYPQISFGVHLNIDEFCPLTDSSVFMKYGLLDDNGSFKKEYLLNSDIIYCDELYESIYNEWDAQIKRVVDSGITPSHVDSHEHTHGIFELQTTLVRLMKGYGIKRVRRRPYPSMFDMAAIKLLRINQSSRHVTNNQSVESMSTKNRHSFIIRRMKQLLDARRHRKWIKDMGGEGFVMTDYFEGYQVFYNCYPRLFKYRKMGIIELMTHPGHKGYQEETEKLMRKELKRVCQYELMNYNQL